MTKRAIVLITILLLACSLTAQAGNIIGPSGQWAWFVSHGAVDDGSVLYWQFANTNDPTPDSSFVSTNTGTLGAGAAKPTWIAATGGVSACYSFDGGDDVTKTHSPSVNVHTDANWAVEFWAYPQATSNMVPIEKGAFTADGWYWYFNTDLSVQWTFQAPSQTSLASGLGYNLVWQHWVGVQTDATHAVIYRNGKQTVAGTAAQAVAGTRDFKVGQYSSAGFGWKGNIDGDKLYKTPLTAAQVATNFWLSATNHGWTEWDYDNRNGLFTNLALHLPFNYAVAADVSTNGNHGTVDGATWKTSGTAVNSGTYDFDGINDTIAMTVAQTKSAYCLWAKTNTTWRHYATLGGTQYVDGSAASFTNKFWFTSGTTVTLGKNAGTYGDFEADEFYIFTSFTPAQLATFVTATTGKF